MHEFHQLDDSLGRIETRAAPRADTGGPHCSTPTHTKANAPLSRVLAEHHDVWHIYIGALAPWRHRHLKIDFEQPHSVYLSAVVEQPPDI